MQFGDQKFAIFFILVHFNFHIKAQEDQSAALEIFSKASHKHPLIIYIRSKSFVTVCEKAFTLHRMLLLEIIAWNHGFQGSILAMGTPSANEAMFP